MAKLFEFFFLTNFIAQKYSNYGYIPRAGKTIYYKAKFEFYPYFPKKKF